MSTSKHPFNSLSWGDALAIAEWRESIIEGGWTLPYSTPKTRNPEDFRCFESVWAKTQRQYGKYKKVVANE